MKIAQPIRPLSGAFAAVLAFAPLASANAAADSARPAAPAIRPALPALAPAAAKTSTLAVPVAAPAAKPAAPVLKAAEVAAQTRPGTVAVPRPADTAKPPASPTPGTPAMPPPTGSPAADPLKDSAVARVYRVAPKPYRKDEAAQLAKILGLRLKSNRPDSNAVNLVFRDERGALLAFEPATSEYAYSNDSVPFLDAKDYLPDSLIRRRTDEALKAALKGRAGEYAFVNYEKTLVQKRDESRKDGAAEPVPAYYIGRYLRKVGGRHVLGDAFQARVSVGAGGAVTHLSWRDPVLADSARQEKVPTREMVKAYLEKWQKQPRRLGRQVFPYHPDNLRIRGLKPVQVFESYVQVREKSPETATAKGGTTLVPRVTVVAEVDLAPSTQRLRTPPPPSPVLLHFHFPCTPQAGLCWPDGKQGLREAAPPPTPSQGSPTAPSKP